MTRLYSGKTMRNINNPLIEYWESQKLDALPMGMQGIVSGEIMAGARQADKLELVMNPAGQISGMLHETRPAKEIFERDGAPRRRRSSSEGLREAREGVGVTSSAVRGDLRCARMTASRRCRGWT